MTHPDSDALSNRLERAGRSERGFPTMSLKVGTEAVIYLLLGRNNVAWRHAHGAAMVR